MTETNGGGASRSTDPAAGSSAATDVSLREYLQEKYRFLGFALGATVAFGAFAWSEIQRRLEILNHENARLLTQQEKTVSQDTYAANEGQRHSEQTDLQAWRKDVDKVLNQAVTRDELAKDTRQETRAASADRRGSYSLGLQILAGGIGLILFILVIFTTYKAIKPNIPQQTTTIITTTPAPIIVPTTTTAP